MKLNKEQVSMNHEETLDSSIEVVILEDSREVHLQKPSSCHELVTYYHLVNPIEQRYLVQKILAWMNTGEMPLSEQSWRDGIAILALNDADVSSTWLQRLYTVWQEDLSQLP